MLSKILAEVRQCVDADAMGMALALHLQLIRLAKEHFRDEEALMRSTGFDEFSASEHIVQHDSALRLLSEVAGEMRRCYESEQRHSESLTIALPEIAGWLTEHTMMMDGRLARHVHGRNRHGPGRGQW